MRLIDADEMFAEFAAHPEWNFGAAEVARMIDNAPTIDAEMVRHGYWLDEGAFAGMRRCSECRVYNDQVNRHCCGCGAKMDADVPSRAGKEQG